RHHGAGAKRQGGNPGYLALGFLKKLVADAEGIVHQAPGGFDGIVGRKAAPPFGSVTDTHVRRPPLRQAVLERHITLIDIYAVVLAAGFYGDVILLTAAPNMVRRGFIVAKAKCKFAL